jgi:uncharacterized protein YkwD
MSCHMVNRLRVALAATLVILVSIAVGVVIGMTFGGEDGSPAAPAPDTPTPDGNAAATVAPTTVTATQTATTTATATATETATETATTRTPIPPSRFSRAEIERAIRAAVNERRADRGLDSLSNEGDVGIQLRAMARSHSANLSVEGRVVHTIDGQTSSDRYEAFNLYDQCQFQSSEGNYIVKPDRPEEAQLEALGRTYAGETYTSGGEERFNANETAVAEAIVDQWFETTTYRERLLLDNAERLGVGVEVTNSSSVWVTGNLC